MIVLGKLVLLLAVISAIYAALPTPWDVVTVAVLILFGHRLDLLLFGDPRDKG